MSKGNSLNGKERIVERMLEHKGGKIQWVEIWVHIINFPSLKFSKLYLQVETKISDIVWCSLSVCRGTT